MNPLKNSALTASEGAATGETAGVEGTYISVLESLMWAASLYSQPKSTPRNKLFQKTRQPKNADEASAMSCNYLVPECDSFWSISCLLCPDLNIRCQGLSSPSSTTTEAGTLFKSMVYRVRTMPYTGWDMFKIITHFHKLGSLPWITGRRRKVRAPGDPCTDLSL
jgi:hypothetical protein